MSRAAESTGVRSDGSGAQDWAFRATNAEVFEALAAGRHRESLREYFGTAALEELSALAARAEGAKRRNGPRAVIVPGMMGSRLADAGRGQRTTRAQMLWVDPLRIRAGHLKRLALPSKRTIRPSGVLLAYYARLKLELEIRGFDARFYPYDWRLGIDVLGARLAAAIAGARRPSVLIAHSMGGLVARIAAARLPRRTVRRLILLGAPNRGALAPVLALRGAYPFVRKLSRLDLVHTPADLAEVFHTFPSLYHLLPAEQGPGCPDLLDLACWPSAGLKPDARLLGSVAAARARMAPPDERMVQIVGVNHETVVSVQRAGAGFEYVSSRNGDGTVPVGMALLPDLESYYADEVHGNLANNPCVIAAIADLAHGGRTRSLKRRYIPCGDRPRLIDEGHLRCPVGNKIDWRLLDSAQREAVLADLESEPQESFLGSAKSLA